MRRRMPQPRERTRLAVCFGAALASTLYPTGGEAGAQTIYFVDHAAVGNNDGTSWKDAFTDLHDALDAAQPGDQVWVAAGTYRPDRGTGDRLMSFQLPSGVELYGGFAGTEECLEERDWVRNETILSGDLNGDDGPKDCSQVSDCCREHPGPGCDDPECQAIVCAFNPACCDPTSLDGWNYYCLYYAQGACCHLSRQTCENSYRLVTAQGADPPSILDGFTGVDTYARYYDDPPGWGYAAVYCNPCSVTIRNCRFDDNEYSAIAAGSPTGSRVTLLDSSFERNGHALEASSTEVTVTRCTFNDDFSGLSVQWGNTRVESCTFTRNYSPLSVHGDAAVSHSTFQQGGPVYLRQGRSTVNDCRFVGSRVNMYLDGNVVVDNTTFIGSTNGGIGGGPGSALFRNCAFINNAPRSGALFWGFGNLYVLNCTIVGNGLDNPYYSGGIGTNDEFTSAQVLNSIIWGNGAIGRLTREQNQVRVYPGSSMEIDHSIVEGWSGELGGDGNSGADPMLLDLDGLDDIPGTEDDNVRLAPGSPAINAGFLSQYLTPTELDGHARILCGQVDIGAYEFGIGDYNCDQTVDLTDFAHWPACMTGPGDGPYVRGCEAFDFNADGHVDLRDVAGLYPQFAP